MLWSFLMTLCVLLVTCLTGEILIVVFIVGPSSSQAASSFGNLSSCEVWQQLQRCSLFRNFNEFQLNAARMSGDRRGLDKRDPEHGPGPPFRSSLAPPDRETEIQQLRNELQICWGRIKGYETLGKPVWISIPFCYVCCCNNDSIMLNYVVLSKWRVR